MICASIRSDAWHLVLGSAATWWLIVYITAMHSVPKGEPLKKHYNLKTGTDRFIAAVRLYVKRERPLLLRMDIDSIYQWKQGF